MKNKILKEKIDKIKKMKHMALFIFLLFFLFQCEIQNKYVGVDSMLIQVDEQQLRELLKDTLIFSDNNKAELSFDIRNGVVHVSIKKHDKETFNAGEELSLEEKRIRLLLFLIISFVILIIYSYYLFKSN